jgi:hypothetical protein
MARPSPKLRIASSTGAPQFAFKGRDVHIALHPNPQPRLKAFGGGHDDRWNNKLAVGLLNALPGTYRAEGCNELANATIAGLSNIKPSDPIEGMIVAQMIAAHEAALNLYARAWNAQSFEVRTKYLALADKAARTVAALSEALDRHRGRGQQTVVVKHVTVNADQAVVADQVLTGGGVRSKNDEQPDAQAAIAHARSSPLPCPLQENRETVPVAGNAERSVQTARRQVTRGAERK